MPTYETASFRMAVGHLNVVVHVTGCRSGQELVAPDYTISTGTLLVAIGAALEEIQRRFNEGRAQEPPV
jgi:hypothetical protein